MKPIHDNNQNTETKTIKIKIKKQPVIIQNSISTSEPSITQQDQSQEIKTIQLHEPPTTVTPTPFQSITLSEEQQTALELFKQRKNLFITGPGGTGKTLLIKEFIKHAYLEDKEIQVCALTGCASLLLGHGARTIHSWSGIRLAKGDPKE